MIGALGQVVLGQGMWADGGDHMSGGWWWAMGIAWIAFLAVLVVVGFTLIRRLTPIGGEHRRAHDVLAERFARGEIDEVEYRARRDALEG